MPSAPGLLPTHADGLRTTSEWGARAARARGTGKDGLLKLWKVGFFEGFSGSEHVEAEGFLMFFCPRKASATCLSLASSFVLEAVGSRLQLSRLSENPWDGQHSDEQGDEGYERLAACDQRSSTAIFDHWDDHSLDVGTCSAKSLVPSTANVIFGDPMKAMSGLLSQRHQRPNNRSDSDEMRWQK